MASAKDIAASVPPPDKLVKGDEPETDDNASEEGDEEAAELSVMEEFAGSLKTGDVSDQLEAFKKLLATCKY